MREAEVQVTEVKKKENIKEPVFNNNFNRNTKWLKGSVEEKDNGFKNKILQRWKLRLKEKLGIEK